MKKLLVVAACMAVLALAAGPALAELSYGVIGGVGLAKFTGDDAGNTKSKVGFSAGAFAQLPLLNVLALHPEALFSFRGSGYESDTKVNLYYIDVPVLVKYNLPIPLPVKTNVFAGPYLGLNFIAKQKDPDQNIGDQVEELDYGLVFGGGAEVSKLMFDIRYSLGLAEVYESGDKIKNGVLSVMVGYRLK
ncbi:MAG: porin family protein [Spirochaetota bacterium]